MKTRKRVVTSFGAAGKSAPLVRPKRTPTVRRIKPAIMPVEPTRPRIAQTPAASEPAPVANLAIDLSVDLGRGLVLRNPLIAASGPYGYGVEVADLLDLSRIGALVTRTTTLRGSSGGSSVRPRIVEVAGGIVSGVGLQNPGIDVVLERFPPTWARWKTPVILSIAGESLGDVVALVNRLEGEPGISGLELNVLDPGSARAFVSAVRRASDLPLIAKLGPEAADIRALARAIESDGADAIAAINAMPALALAPDRTAWAFGSNGYLSGPAIRPIGLRAVAEIAQAVEIPVIGMGGVSTLGDVLDYLGAGASAVGVATAALAEPDLPAWLAAALANHCQARGVTLASLMGTARPRRRRRSP